MATEFFRMNTQSFPVLQQEDGRRILGRPVRKGEVKPVLLDSMQEAKSYATRLCWDNRPSKFCFYVLRTARRVRYGLEVLRTPKERES